MKKFTQALFHLLIGQFMFYAAHDSDEYALQVGSTATPLDPTEAHGRIRIGHFNFDSLTGAADDTLNLLKMPAGKVRVLALHVNSSPMVATADLDVGYGAYTKRGDRTTVVANPNAFADNLDVATGGVFHTYPDAVIDSAGGWTLTGLLQTAGASADTLSGWVEYVVD